MRVVTLTVTPENDPIFRCVATDTEGEVLGAFETRTDPLVGKLHQIYAESHARALQAFVWHVLRVARLRDRGEP